MKKIFFALVVLSFIWSQGRAQESTQYAAALEEMFKVSGSEEVYKAAIRQMITMYKQQNPDAPSEVWNEIEGEFLQTNMDDLVKMLVPIYSKYLTVENIKEITEFYQTPVGKKFAKNQPAIMQESMQAGQEWGQALAQKLIQKLKDKGY